MKKVFVVGASSAIGIAICQRYLENGWRVLAHCNNSEKKLSSLSVNYSEKLEVIRISFDDSDNLENLLAQFYEKYIDCDALIYCVGILEPQEYDRLTIKSILLHLSINLLPSIMLTRDLGPAMAARGWGRIVNLSSIGVKFGGGPNSFSYALSKHGLEMMPWQCNSWARNNVLVNTLRVGVTNTTIHELEKEKDMDVRVSLIPMKRMAEPVEIATTAWFLGSDENSYITGQIISISGGE